MDGDRKANFHEIVFQARPGSPELNCCSVNAARGLGLLSEWALMSDGNDDGLVLNWYGPGRLAARLRSGTEVRLASKTDYPRTGRGRDHRRARRSPARFPLRLRIPHWSARTTVKVNGEAVADVKPATYLELTRSWKPGRRDRPRPRSDPPRLGRRARVRRASVPVPRADPPDLRPAVQPGQARRSASTRRRLAGAQADPLAGRAGTDHPGQRRDRRPVRSPSATSPARDSMGRPTAPGFARPVPRSSRPAANIRGAACRCRSSAERNFA